MIIKSTNLHQFAKRVVSKTISSLNMLSQSNFIDKKSLNSKFLSQNIFKYQFSTSETSKDTKVPISENFITMAIEDAVNTEQLQKVISKYFQFFNHIHRNALLSKVTKHPFNRDEQLVSNVVNQIKVNWKYDFPAPSYHNSRAIANIIAHLGRGKKLHDLDEEIAAIDFFQLAKFLNPKEFVMAINGVLKLELLQKVIQNTPKFNFQGFLVQNINDSFTPDLLVSMWFNTLKFQKSTQKINDFFANLLKAKQFKTNLIDYMQIVFCYVNSEGKRSVDLTYPISAYPKKFADKKGYLGAQELSVLYEQLSKLRKIKEIYFSEEFNQLLESCYLRILTERNIQLRNVANVFVYLIQYENPTSKTLEATFHQYFAVLKNECNLLEKHQPDKKFRANVDPLSFVSLFSQLLEYYQADNTYLTELAGIVLKYVEKIIQHKILCQYNEKTFVRLLASLDLAQKMYMERNPGKIMQLNESIKGGIETQIKMRKFSEVVSLSKILEFSYRFDIRSKQVCFVFKRLIASIPEGNQLYETYQQKLQQPCILNKSCINCANCFSKK